MISSGCLQIGDEHRLKWHLFMEEPCSNGPTYWIWRRFRISGCLGQAHCWHRTNHSQCVKDCLLWNVVEEVLLDPAEWLGISGDSRRGNQQPSTTMGKFDHILCGRCIGTHQPRCIYSLQFTVRNIAPFCGVSWEYSNISNIHIVLIIIPIVCV